jgi:hypothetical protein
MMQRPEMRQSRHIYVISFIGDRILILLVDHDPVGNLICWLKMIVGKLAGYCMARATDLRLAASIAGLPE